MIIPLDALKAITWELVGAVLIALVIVYWPERRRKKGPWDRK